MFSRMTMFFASALCILVMDIVLLWAKPHIRLQRQLPPELLGLPSNATTIRDQISTSFTCDSRHYGYYADPDNDCQLFHVCLPVQYTDGTQQTFKWSFICPQETVFNQETFTCARPEDSVACQDSPLFYSLNDRFGQMDSTAMSNTTSTSPTSEEEQDLQTEN